MKKEKAVILSRREPADGIIDLLLSCSFASEAKPGQFVLIYPSDTAHLLGRPICICDADPLQSRIRLMFRISGEGTRLLSGLRENDSVDIEGPLGKGYPMEQTEGKRVLLIGGGIGAPSLFYPARFLMSRQTSEKRAESVTAILGYRNAALRTFLSDEFAALGVKTVIATDDGSSGIKGTVIDAFRKTEEEGEEKPEIIFSCGPVVMLKAVKECAFRKGIRTFVSLEERMACGVGACLGCVVKTKEKDGHSQVNRARICTEGPVFEASEVIL